MSELSPLQTKIILAGIIEAGVHAPALQQDLLDHMCCLVEGEMSEGKNFAKAYANTLEKFESLRLIQVYTDQSIYNSRSHGTLSRFLECTMTGVYLAFALLSFLAPLFLSVYHGDLSFLILFFPFICLGPFIIITRIDYKRFSIIPFKENIFPGSLIH